jgi:tryptophan synthase alpha chain
MSQRYEVMFQRLETENRIAWIPFIMLGYPSIEQSIRDIQTLIDSGADALELGVPFSDPVADGPVIQEAARVALENHVKVTDCLKALKKVRISNPDIPIGLLVYANLVYRPGVEQFYQLASEMGVDSILIADVPVGEATRFVPLARAADIDPVFIAPPNATEESLSILAQHCKGYTYVVSRPGVTGNHVDVEYPVQVLQYLNDKGAPPAVLGFGISQPAHVTKAVEAGFKGVISGSAVVKLIHEHGENVTPVLHDFSTRMYQATHKAST